MKKSLPIERAFRSKPPTLKRAEFWFDGGERVPGWSTGEDWNGWGVPLFDERQIEAARAALRAAGMESDFHSGDILELWPVEEPDLLIEHEAIRLNGKTYWQLDSLTWNEDAQAGRIEESHMREDSYEVTTHIAGSKPERHSVSSLAAASAAARTAIDDAGIGASDMGRQHGVLKRNGRVIGRVAYNGRIFDLDNKIMWDNRTSPGVREDRFSIPGWSVGYNDEISAHAAVRTPAGKGRNWLFVMTSPEDREPRSLDEEVAVGLYFLTEDGDWEQIAYQDFPDVRSVIKLGDVELWLVIEHGMSADQARALLEEDFFDWTDDPGSPVSVTSWMNTILKDAGVHPSREGVEVAANEAIEQIRNASPAQILEYMNERSEAINE
jgi:hypothetical protein